MRDVLKGQPVSPRLHGLVDDLARAREWVLLNLRCANESRKLLDEVRGQVLQHPALEKDFHVDRNILLEKPDESHGMVVRCICEDRADIVDPYALHDYPRADEHQTIEVQLVLV